MKKKKIQKEGDLAWLDRLSSDELTNTTGGKAHLQILATIRVYF